MAYFNSEDFYNKRNIAMKILFFKIALILPLHTFAMTLGHLQLKARNGEPIKELERIVAKYECTYYEVPVGLDQYSESLILDYSFEQEIVINKNLEIAFDGLIEPLYRNRQQDISFRFDRLAFGTMRLTTNASELLIEWTSISITTITGGPAIISENGDLDGYSLCRVKRFLD